MMNSFILLATEAVEVAHEAAEAAHEAHEGGFGLNFDILETNLINLVLLLGILIYFGSKVVSSALGARRDKIAQAIQEAEARQKKATAALAEQQQNLAKAQAEAKQIREAATTNAQTAKEAILAQAAKDVERLKETAQQDLNSEQERVIAELKQRIAALALERVESQLSSGLNDESQQKLVNRSIAQLGGS